MTASEVALLLKFYQRAQHFSGGGIYGDSIADHINFADELRTSILLGRLKAAGFVEKRGVGDNSRTVFGVTAEGEKFIESLMEGQSGLLDNAIKLLSGSAPQEDNPAPGEVEDGDAAWSPIPIDREEPEFLEAESTLANATATIKADNGYAATVPVERAEVVTRLEAALSLMKSAPAITANAIKTQVVWPLKKAAARFNGETVVGATIKLAWDTFSKWVAKHGGEFLDGLF